jgi:hypothetical protein
MDEGLAIRIAAAEAKRSALHRSAHPIECSCCSRVALCAHRLSDVVAGVLLGIAWLTLCCAVVGMLGGNRPPR